MTDIYKELFSDDELGIQSDVVDFAHLIEQEKPEVNTTAKVYSISAEFGIGKTFFCDKLKSVLEKDEVHVTKMNIWEMDFYENPLIPILIKLNELYSKNGEKLPTKLIGKVINFTKKSSIAAGEYFVEALSNKLTGTGLVDKVQTHFSPDTIYDDFADYQNTMNDLRKKMISWTNKLETPVVVIIDELDRCRPDYAVKTLEALKHFFNIPGFVFVLALDEKQLEASVKHLFGTENYDGYKRKFINNSFLLPNPDKAAFVKYLYKKTGMDKIIEQIQNNNRDLLFKAKYQYRGSAVESSNTSSPEEVQSFNKIQTPESIITRYFAAYSEWFKFTLRQMEQVFDRLVIFTKQIATSNELFSPDLTVLFVCLHEFNKEIYNVLKDYESELPPNVLNKIHSSSIDSISYSIYKDEAFKMFGKLDRTLIPTTPLLEEFSTTKISQQKYETTVHDNLDRFFYKGEDDNKSKRWIVDVDIHNRQCNGIDNNRRIAFIVNRKDKWSESKPDVDTVTKFNLKQFRETYFEKMSFLSRFEPIKTENENK